VVKRRGHGGNWWHRRQRRSLASILRASGSIFCAGRDDGGGWYLGCQYQRYVKIVRSSARRKCDKWTTLARVGISARRAPARQNASGRISKTASLWRDDSNIGIERAKKYQRQQHHGGGA